MRNIPAEDLCTNCPFFAFPAVEWGKEFCNAFEDEPAGEYARKKGYLMFLGQKLTEFDGVGNPKRLPACLSAYPHGATVTITPKEGK